MQAVRPLLFIILEIVIPYCLGRGVCFALRTEGRFRAAPAAWLVGLLTAFAVFMPLAVPLIWIDGSLSRLTGIYIPVLAVLSLGSVVLARREIAADLRELFGLRELLVPISLREKWPVYGAIALGLIEACVAMLFAHVDDDDAEYVVIAQSALQTDTLIHYNPYTGKKFKHRLFKRIISPFSLWEAVQAKVTGFHAAVICHFLLPGILVAAGIVALFLFFDMFFGIEFAPGSKERERRPWVALLVMELILAFGNYSTRSIGSMLLLRPWQGKALVCGVMLPLLFAVIFAQLREPVNRQSIGLLLIIVTSGALCSAVADLLLPMALLAAAFVKGKNQGIRQGVLLFCTALPGLLLDVLALLYA